MAVLPSGGLGDGLIQIVIAKGLQAAGYEVTYLHDGAHRLRDRLKGLRTHRRPASPELPRFVTTFDAVLFDAGAYFVVHDPRLRAWLLQHGVGYSIGNDAPPPGRAQLDPACARLSRLNRSLRVSRIVWPRPPLVRQVAAQVARRLALGDRSIDIGLDVPRPDAPTRRTRVCIHPEASMPTKCWGADRFLDLASRLAADGWKPALTVAPWERERWIDRAEGRFEVPLFRDELELADYYAASRAFLGNDSGNAHVASLVGLPSVVLFRRSGSFPTWRASSARSIVPWAIERRRGGRSVRLRRRRHATACSRAARPSSRPRSGRARARARTARACSRGRTAPVTGR